MGQNDYTTCPPFDPINEGFFGTAEHPQYATRLFVKTSDSPVIRDYMEKPGISFVDDGFIEEIRKYNSTRVFVHEYFNRTSLTRRFAGFGYTGYNETYVQSQPRIEV